VIIGVDGKEPFVLELYADEAPLHASSFLALARGGYYTGRSVIGVDAVNGVRFEQHDGDHHPLLGQPLRPEDSLLPFARGSLVSVPVYSRDGERWDAVGEWQITLLPRPDLRGRGTCWGRVYIGMRVVDRLAPGDRIASIEIVD
jgi:cyclophilin family peptidyl-prolyl cis-trans isomerase